jgi:hypothetical protein
MLQTQCRTVLFLGFGHVNVFDNFQMFENMLNLSLNSAGLFFCISWLGLGPLGNITLGLGAPDGIGGTPNGIGSAPGAIGSTPKAIGSIPNAIGSTPNAIGSPLHGMRSTPNGSGSTPDGIEITPNATGSTPNGIGIMIWGCSTVRVLSNWELSSRATAFPLAGKIVWSLCISCFCPGAKFAIGWGPLMYAFRS